ncbi:O-antigen ligase family protein [Patescibacteria group bacterium]|nr:O-antigen ligase family protein [Patescibacteria group bacterium]
MKIIAATRRISQKYLEYALLALAFLLPTQIGLHLWPDWSILQGIRIDYWSPTLYLTDILVFVVLAFWIISDRDHFKKVIKRNQRALVAIFVLCLLTSLTAQRYQVSLLKTIKIMELAFFTLFIANTKLNIRKILPKPLFVSLVTFFLIGLIQFLIGHSIGGIFWALGEREFTSSTVGISLMNFFGNERIRAYSTFSHPNSFAGYYLISIVLLLFLAEKTRKKILPFLIVMLVSVLVITNSYSAILAAVLGAGLYFIKTKKVFRSIALSLFLGTTLISIASPIIFKEYLSQGMFIKEIGERVFLSITAGELLAENFLLGVGLNNFIIYLPEYYKTSGIWILQPVHNLSLLLTVETGIAGLVLFILFLGRALERNLKSKNKVIAVALLIVMITGLSDHYWFTLQQNQLLFALLLGLALRKKDSAKLSI